MLGSKIVTTIAEVVPGDESDTADVALTEESPPSNTPITYPCLSPVDLAWSTREVW